MDSSTRGSDNFQFTGRAMLTADARNQSEYGTIRGYLRIGAVITMLTRQPLSPSGPLFNLPASPSARRNRSSDIFSTTELMSYFDAKTSGDTYNYGVKVLAYTAQFGNGFSGTISAELGHYSNVYGVCNGGIGLP